MYWIIWYAVQTIRFLYDYWLTYKFHALAKSYQKNQLPHFYNRISLNFSVFSLFLTFLRISHISQNFTVFPKFLVWTNFSLFSLFFSLFSRGEPWEIEWATPREWTTPRIRPSFYYWSIRPLSSFSHVLNFTVSLLPTLLGSFSVLAILIIE